MGIPPQNSWLDAIVTVPSGWMHPVWNLLGCRISRPLYEFLLSLLLWAPDKKKTFTVEVQSTMAGNSQRQELEAADHTVSAVKKQSDAGRIHMTILKQHLCKQHYNHVDSSLSLVLWGQISVTEL